MTATLNEVFDLFGYKKQEQQSALIKLAAYRGCFGEKNSVGENYSDKVISNLEASVLLSKTFVTIQEGIAWWHEVTQKNWLRPSFNKEGFGKGKDPVINVERHHLTDAKQSSEDANQLFHCFKTLGLLDTTPFPDEKVNHVVIHGGIEKYASERIHFIPDFSGQIVYVTNPRGLFNDEPSLAPILASWFNKPESEKLIQAVLDEHKDMKKSDKHWLKDLEGLKKEILKKIGESNWPTGKGWYYKNPKPYEDAAQSERRQSPAGWPTAADMVDYLLQQRAKKENKFKHLEFIPIYSVRPGRVANTEDNIEDWYATLGKHLPIDSKAIFVSNNSLQLHYIGYQDVILKDALHKMGNIPGKNCCEVMTVGPGSNQTSLSYGTDALARTFFMKRSRVLKELSQPTHHYTSSLWTQSSTKLNVFDQTTNKVLSP